jgi:hypothetical protein
MIPESITQQDVEAVIAATIKGRSDGAKANLAALQHLRGIPGFITVADAAKASECAESTIYTARERVRHAIACNHKSRELAGKYRAGRLAHTLSCKSLLSNQKQGSLNSSNDLPGMTPGAANIKKN